MTKRLGFRPYKFHHSIALKEDDSYKRMSFCEWFVSSKLEQPSLEDDILFTDEAVFHLHRGTNHHNQNYWVKDNPHMCLETHHAFNPKIMVWCGIHNKTVVGPYFFDSRVDSNTYLQMLEQFVDQYLHFLPPEVRSRMYFQHDGATPHFAKITRDWLNTKFPGRWIGRGGPVEWPPRSPDLTPMDFFFWNCVKSKVYDPQPRSVEVLKQHIMMGFKNIPVQCGDTVVKGLVRRVHECLANNGAQFEHLL